MTAKENIACPRTQTELEALRRRHAKNKVKLYAKKTKPALLKGNENWDYTSNCISNISLRADEASSLARRIKKHAENSDKNKLPKKQILDGTRIYPKMGTKQSINDLLPGSDIPKNKNGMRRFEKIRNGAASEAEEEFLVCNQNLKKVYNTMGLKLVLDESFRARYKANAAERDANKRQQATETSKTLPQNKRITAKKQQQLSCCTEKTAMNCRRNERSTMAKLQTKIKCDSAKQQMKSVRFNEVYVRVHEQILGDNPACSGLGPSLALGWKHRDLQTFHIDEWEKERMVTLRPRPVVQLLLTGRERKEIAKKWGFTDKDMSLNTCAVQKIQKQRDRTTMGLMFARAFSRKTT